MTRLYRVDIGPDPRAEAEWRAQPVLKQEYDPDLGARDGVVVVEATLKLLVDNGRVRRAELIGELVGMEHFDARKKTKK